MMGKSSGQGNRRVDWGSSTDQANPRINIRGLWGVKLTSLISNESARRRLGVRGLVGALDEASKWEIGGMIAGWGDLDKNDCWSSVGEPAGSKLPGLWMGKVGQ